MPTKKKVVYLVSAEMVPYAKVGGLADVAGALPAALKRQGCLTGSFLPAYRDILKVWIPKSRFMFEVFVPVRGRMEKARIHRYEAGNAPPVYFVENKGFFDRDGIYGPAGKDYPDNWARYAFFCLAVLETLRDRRLPGPDILHVHDWHTSLLPVYLKEFYANEPRFLRTRSVLTIHNLAYQGLFERKILPDIGLTQPSLYEKKMEFWGKANFLKGGLLETDSITTVSPAYASEILTRSEGCGLDAVLRARKKRLRGILNGLDPVLWNPATDRFLEKNYSSKDPGPENLNKAALEKECGWEAEEGTLLCGMVTRLCEQKGFDLLLRALPGIFRLPVRLVVLGTGEDLYRGRLEEAVRRYKRKLAYIPGFNEKMAHRIYAGSDVFLMPSRFEPCGLGQMIALRYGSVPVVRRTGGLADTVLDVKEEPRRGNGFLFDAYRSESLIEVLERVVRFHGERRRWKRLQARVMRCDFSWDRSARGYAGLYGRLLRTR